MIAKNCIRLFSFAILILMSSCRSVIPKSHLDSILRERVLRVGTTGDYQPYSYADQAGKYSGIDIELAEDLAHSLGVSLQLVPTSWPTLLQDLQAGRFDIAMSGISKKLIRQQVGLFSASYTVSGKTPIVRCSDTTRLSSLEQIDRPGVRIVVNPGGTNELFVRQKITSAEVIVHPDNKTIFAEIIAQRADVMITDAEEVQLKSSIHQELCPAMPGRTFDKFAKGFLLPRDLIWKAYVDEWLRMRQLEGKLTALFEKYLHE